MKGFALIETLISMLILTLLVSGIFASFVWLGSMCFHSNLETYKLIKESQLKFDYSISDTTESAQSWYRVIIH